MLKTLKDGRLWLVTQPDHGRVAGYLAAHWGNDQFTPPGSYASVPEPGRLRAETIFAVAQHDNGWWEWEAAPDLAEADGLPLDLAEVLRDPAAGMERWRKGLSRYPNKPYTNLLFSCHAYWLYAIRALPDPDPAFRLRSSGRARWKRCIRAAEQSRSISLPNWNHSRRNGWKRCAWTPRRRTGLSREPPPPHATVAVVRRPVSGVVFRLDSRAHGRDAWPGCRRI